MKYPLPSINETKAAVLKTSLLVVAIFVVSRGVVMGFGYLGYLMTHSTAPLYHVFCQWDCGWYNSIINHGYETEPINHRHESAASWAFFPLHPLTLYYTRELLFFLGHNSDLFIVNGFLLCSLLVLYRYYKINHTTRDALFCLLLVAFSPYSVYFSVPYTESLALLLALLVFYHASVDQWVYAGLFAALLSATKVIGVLIVFPMLVIALRKYSVKSLIRLDQGTEHVVFSLILAPLGLFLYMFYLYHHVGDVFAFKNVQVAWSRQIGNPVTVLLEGLSNPFNIKFYFALITVSGLGLTAYLVKRRLYPEAILLGLGILMPLSTHLVSIPRYIFGLFPVYIAIEMMTRDQALLRYLVFAVFSASSAFIAVALTNSVVYVN